jgi:hypothetical protein
MMPSDWSKSPTGIRKGQVRYRGGMPRNQEMSNAGANPKATSDIFKAKGQVEYLRNRAFDLSPINSTSPLRRCSIRLVTYTYPWSIYLIMPADRDFCS